MANLLGYGRSFPTWDGTSNVPWERKSGVAADRYLHRAETIMKSRPHAERKGKYAIRDRNNSTGLTAGNTEEEKKKQSK